MSTVDEVLATAEVVDAVCVIDGETRIISVPNEYKELGVESDEKVTRIKFRCPKIVGDNVDLTEYNLYINYRNAANKLNSYLVEDVVVTDNTINFSWLLSRHVTERPGTISYIVCAKKSDYTGVINEWNTKVATGTVGVGLEAVEEIEEQNIDIIEQILRSIVELENSAGGSGIYIGSGDMPDGYNVQIDPDGTPSDITLFIDETLTEQGKAADAKATGDALHLLSEEIANLSAGGISATARELLITVLRNGVYISDQSANITDLETALGGSGGETEKTLISISATYSGGDVAVGTAVTDLTGIVVTATYSDGSTATVTDYTMSGEIAEGSNTITVTYKGMITTFTVTGIAESSGGEEVSVDIQSLLTADGYYYDGYASINGKTNFKGTSLDGGTTPAYAIQLVSGATYTLKTALNGDGTGVYGPGAFSGATNGSTTGAWRGNINKISSIEKTSEEINSGVYLLTYTFKAPIGTTYLSVGCLNEYVSYASLSYHQE